MFGSRKNKKPETAWREARRPQYRADTAFTNGLNKLGIFSGTILNRENIGKSGDELVAKWNSDNPTDQVTFSEN
jgi:hypothetical protein